MPRGMWFGRMVFWQICRQAIQPRVVVLVQAEQAVVLQADQALARRAMALQAAPDLGQAHRQQEEPTTQD